MLLYAESPEGGSQCSTPTIRGLPRLATQLRNQRARAPSAKASGSACLRSKIDPDTGISPGGPKAYPVRVPRSKNQNSSKPHSHKLAGGVWGIATGLSPSFRPLNRARSSQRGLKLVNRRRRRQSHRRRTRRASSGSRWRSPPARPASRASTRPHPTAWRAAPLRQPGRLPCRL